MDTQSNQMSSQALVPVKNGHRALSVDPVPLTLRDFLAVGFRHRRLVSIAFFGILLLAVLYPFVSLNYESETKILVKHERPPDPVGIPGADRTTYTPDIVTEEELNSEIELITSQDLLRQVVVTCQLHHHKSWLSFIGSITGVAKSTVGIAPPTEDEKIYKAAVSLGRKLNVEAIYKTNIITI